MSKDMEVMMVENKYLVWGGLLSAKVFIVIYYRVAFHWIQPQGGQISTLIKTEKNLCFINSLVFQSCQDEN